MMLFLSIIADMVPYHEFQQINVLKVVTLTESDDEI